MYYQQGDVIVEKVKRIKGEKLQHCILAEGEATGHKHEIKDGARLYESGGVLYLRVYKKEVKLSHEEHKTISLPRGSYIVRGVREYDHFAEEARNVAD